MVDVRRLVWDPGNAAHVAGHGVTLAEVEEVCYGDHIEIDTYSWRTMAVGHTSGGKMIAVILEPPTEGVYRPITARPASRKERRQYDAQRRANEAT